MQNGVMVTAKWTAKLKREIMGIIQKFHKIPTSNNLIREWHNESVLNIFNLSDKLSNGYNIEMLILWLRLADNLAKFFCLVGTFGQ